MPVISGAGTKKCGVKGRNWTLLDKQKASQCPNIHPQMLDRYDENKGLKVLRSYSCGVSLSVFVFDDSM